LVARKRLLIPCAWAAALIWVGSFARAEPARSGSTPNSPAAQPASGTDSIIPIFLNTPADLDTLWERLKQPDFVLLKGDTIPNRLAGARVAPSASEPGSAVVDRVDAHGEVEGDLADLRVDFEITLAEDGPTWVPIRLDRQVVTEARERARDWPLRATVEGGWQIELRGQGRHRVGVRLLVPVQSTVGERRVLVAIPEAASTRFQLDVAHRVVAARAGPDEPVVAMPIEGGRRTRLAAHVTPRPRLDVTWRVESEPESQLPPLLVLQGEIAIDLDPGVLRTRSSWAIQSVRGTARSLQWRLDPDDEVLELELDGQPVPAGIERVAGAITMTLILGEPMRPGAPRKLTMATRRPISSSSAPVVFHGFALANARAQSGAIGIAPSGNLWISGSAGTGLRQIDPRIELTADLRARPATALAYQFVDQPFDLRLRVDESPPLIRTEARTTIALDARRARVDTWLDYETARGRLFELHVALPRDLELESAGPDEVVSSSSIFWEGPRDSPGSGTAGTARALTLRLTSAARAKGAFSIHLVGRQTIDPMQPVRVALFQPRDSTSGGGWIAVGIDRDLTVDWPGARAGQPDGFDAFRAVAQSPPSDWPWPGGRRPPGDPALWLRHEGAPAVLPLQVALHPRTLTHQTTLLAQFDRRGVEVRQETACTVQFGALTQLEIEVPAALVGRWDLEGGEEASREDLGVSSRSGRRYRLKFAREVTDDFRLVFHYRLALRSKLEADPATTIELDWIRVLEGTSAPIRVRCAAEPDIVLESPGRGWTESTGEPAHAPGESGPPIRLTWVGSERRADPLRILARAHAQAPLPATVATRLWLTTVQTPENDLRTTARYWVETHSATLAVALPPGAEWVRALAGGVAVSQVERLPRAAGYRVRFPAQVGAGAVLVEVEYTVPPRWARTAWAPSRLLDGGIVEQTLWDVRVPWNQVVVGVPAGWIDENHWTWDVSFWNRRPWKNSTALAAWVTGSSSRSPAGGEAVDDDRNEYHGALFGRPGPPADLPIVIASRAGLVALCSGSVLGIGGILILAWRPPFRLAWAAVLAFTLAVATAVEPSTTILVAQSALLGVVLTGLSALIQRLVDRRRSAAAVFGEPDPFSSFAAPATAASRTGDVGLDDSTAIRVRPPSTMDHVAPTRPAAPPGAAPDPSRRIGGDDESLRPLP
jgi:hypothetical protein